MGYYVGDAIDFGYVDRRSLNLIVSSCGTGKSYFCANELLGAYEWIKPDEVIFVTSRTLAVEQQVHDYESLVKFTKDDPIVDFWSGKKEIDNYAEDTEYEDYYGKIRIMTYDKTKGLFFSSKDGYYKQGLIKNVKMIILDEIHSLYSDMFINGMMYLQMWLHYEIPSGERLFFGLTATPGVLLDNTENLGVRISTINYPIQKYKVKKLWCTDISGMLRLLKENFTGKTVIMCKSVRSCYSLQKEIDGSVVLTGKSGDDYIPFDMDNIRNSIVKNSCLPDDVNILITTSTAREGFTFKEYSNINNVICFYADEMNIHQFVGRCRYDVDNLVVVDYRKDGNKDDYFSSQETLFKDYLEDNTDHRWFNLISDIVDHKVEETTIIVSERKKVVHSVKKPKAENPSIGLFKTSESANNLSKYIENKWKIKTEENDEPPDSKIICGQQMKQQILDEVFDMGVFSNEVKKLSWTAFEKVLTDLGYSITDKRKYVDKKRVRYKVISKEDGD